MADLEDVTLDGRPLQSLRVADLKAALEERGLSKSGQKNALVKRLKGALMLENLQKTSTPHVGLQPNSHIGEEMSQNCFIKQYLAKQQELLRQRLEREAREVYDTNEQKDHAEVNNSTSCPPPAQQDVTPLAEPQKPAGPSGGINDGESNKNKENDSSGPLASGSVTMRVPGGDHRPERGSTSSDVAPDSDDEDSEDGEEDADDDDWDSGARRRNVREPARAPPTRQRSGASCQPQQQHILSPLSPQLRQPTPPPSPPPELSFPLPETPKQSPPSPDVAPGRRSPSSSSSGSSSSGSRSSSPEPERSGPSERKPGPLTLLARKMESEGAFSGAAWHSGHGEGNRQENQSQMVAPFFGRGPPDGLGSTITHTAGNIAFPMIPGTDQGVTGAHSGQIPLPGVVFKATKKGDNVSEAERKAALEMERLEKQRKYEQERAMELEHERALALELEERQRALERDRQMKQQALEREEHERALQREQELALERERQERELALERERQEQALAEEREKVLAQERALELEKQRELEIQRALELERQKALEEEQRLQREREEALELERQARERALEQERLERERALEAERRERIAREMALEQERLEKVRLEEERLEREKVLEKERLERERALELERREREEKEMALERERIEREKALEQERLEKERALELERLEKERALEQERLEKERALEQERLEKERALEQERLEKERALEQERLEKERALEQERLEKERALEQERLEKEQALEAERKEKERIERERLEQERIDMEKALEREREEKARAAALEKERKEKERAEKEEQTRLEREKAIEQQKIEAEKERALEEERGKALEMERLGQEEALQKEKREPERENSTLAEKERDSDSVLSKSGQKVGLTILSTPTTPSSEPGRKSLSEDVQEVPAPVSHSAPPSQTLLSPQSPFKKSRFFRDSPIQPPPSSTSVVIMRPTPRPQSSSVLSPTSVGDQQPSARQEDPQMQTKPDSAGSIEIQSERRETTGDNVQTGFKKTEHRVETTVEKEEEVEERRDQSAPRREGRTMKKEEKPARQRSSSNESSSSESDSGSSSSPSSTSSDSSPEDKSLSSCSRREANSRRDSSPEHMVTDQVSKETQKASPRKRERSGDDDNTTKDGERPTKKPFTEAPTPDDKQRQRTHSGQEEETDQLRQVKETAMAEPEKIPENSEETPKTFSARKISLSNNKLSPGSSGAEGEQESAAAAGRKRRWGSSTAVTAKKPSISITTDSLKSLIPDIRPCLGQEAVVDLHPEEAALSGVEDEERERSDHDLQIRRTVTQVVHPESQENGQKETKRSRLEELEEEDQQGGGEQTRVHEEKMETSFSGAGETQSPSRTSHETGNSTVTPSDTLIRRSISQQKTGVSITIDDPVRTNRQPSPPRGKVSNIVHVCNLVRPFTLGQLKELLSRTGTLVDDGFWIDKIKSHCYVTYSSSEEAVATRAALHGVKWPQSNPKLLSVDFCLQEELDFHKTLGERPDKPGAEEQGPGRGRTAALPSLLPERDQWAEREREMERREKGRAEREWDRDKVREFEKLGTEKEGASRRSRSRERRRKERGKSKEKKSEKKEKPEDPPAKLLDDLFRKTKAAPCIYWLPLTEEQYVQRQADRVERQKEREKRRKELEEEEEKKREEERKERMKAAGGAAGDRSEGEKDKDRDRERDKDRGRDRERERERENEKRRDGYRRPGGSTTGGSRRSRSRSRSDPRDRRR